MRNVLIASALLIGIAAAHAEERRPVVVELFTSQSCNSCPPADAVLGELTARPDVLALSLHVDYWDYIGWKDPFAQRAYTERQRSYSRTLNQRFVYTPQIVVDGTLQGVGSESATVDKLIDKARRIAAHGPAIAVTAADGGGDKRVVHVGDGKAAAPAKVWLVFYDSKHETQVQAGENSGRRLSNYNVVRTLIPIGRWTGSAANFPVDLEAIDADCDGAAVIVQTEETGPIIAAARIDRTKR
jgi:hypothetical protein